MKTDKLHSMRPYVYALMLATSVGLSISKTAWAEVYHWIDERGQKHFSSEPPEENVGEKPFPIGETNSFSGQDAFMSDQDDYPFKYFIFNSSREFERFGKARGEAMMRNMFEGYQSFFKLGFAGTNHLEIHVLRSQGQYFRRQRDIGGGMSKWGHYSLSRKEANLFFNKDMATTMETFYHEISHFLNHWSMPMLPYWLNEGIATYMGNVALVNNTLVIQDNKAHNKWMTRYRSAGHLIPLKKFLNITPGQWFALNQNHNQGYNTSYSLVQFMLSDAAAKKIFIDALGLFNRGLGNTATLSALIEQSYPGGFKAFNLAWQNFYSLPVRAPHLFYRVENREGL